jgi:hypothetical protein
VAFAVLAAVTAVAFGLLGGAGLAQSAVGLAQYQYGKKVTICHKGKRTIRISTRAWPAHKRHGDTLGACAEATKHATKAHAQTTLGGEHGKKAEHGGTSVEGTPSEGGGKGGKDHGKHNG